MNIPSKYDPKAVEDRWYAYWMKKDYFKSTPDERPPFTIVIPPPNVTGVLHMGHMLNNTIQDVLIRRARMQGFNALWLPGTDHASIATEAKVVGRLREKGINKSMITRDEFMEHAWEWKEEHGGIILEQLKKLGASCDWSRTRFTMDEELYDSVIDVFIDLYDKGLIYRGHRMVNWDPKALTALSDEEVIHKELNSKLYYVKYQIDGSKDEYVTIATTRPETILGDTAVCVNPSDERYTHLHGKKVIIPMVNRVVPIITDEYVDVEFGTGCLKITPAHDENDYEIGKKHQLETIDILTDNGKMSDAAQFFIGEDRFKARKLVAAELEKLGILVKTEDYKNKVGYSERTNEVIEPRVSLQWFLDMKKLAEPALEVVMNNTIQFFPEKFKNTYRHWMENVRDWCISRQLWWGQQIPVYYAQGKQVVAKSFEEARSKFETEHSLMNLSDGDIRQDEDVLDTWFSSWLWPISTFDGIRFPDADDINYYYPTSVLVTAPDILFFWVARMIMAGIEYRNEIPFQSVYLTGMVRDKQGRKMSKSLGNSPNPLDLIDEYGADGVRLGMLLTAPAGNDLPFDASLCDQGKKFSNKIWNALRLIKGWEVKEMDQPEGSKSAIQWFDSKLSETIKFIDEQFDKYRLSDALMAIYKLIWDDYCSWYLEMVKPEYQQPIDPKTLEASLKFFEKLMQILHPFMPFISEEIWHMIDDRKDGDDIIISTWPKAETTDSSLEKEFDYGFELINAIRKVRNEQNIPMKTKLELCQLGSSEHILHSSIIELTKKLTGVSTFTKVDEKSNNSFSFLIRTQEFFIPADNLIDKDAELKKVQEELKYTEGFFKSVSKKLSNERFVNNAPEKVVEIERKKMADAEAKIKILKAKLEGFSK